MLFIYDEAPDVMNRQCLAVYPFPLKESVMSDVAIETVPDEKSDRQQLPIPQEIPIPMIPTKPKPLSPIRHVVQAGEWMMFSPFSGTVRLARHIIFTMY